MIQELGRRNRTGMGRELVLIQELRRRNRTGMEERACRDTGVRTEK